MEESREQVVARMRQEHERQQGEFARKLGGNYNGFANPGSDGPENEGGWRESITLRLFLAFTILIGFWAYITYVKPEGSYTVGRIMNYMDHTIEIQEVIQNITSEGV